MVQFFWVILVVLLPWFARSNNLCDYKPEPSYRFVALKIQSLFNKPPPEWELVWSDEFNKEGPPDASKWSYETGGHGWGNGELQYYTSRLENARVENGKLVLEARREKYQGKAYTSARLISRGKGEWTYGRYEVRARVSKGKGSWSAAWLMAAQQTYGEAFWPDNGEIDMLEHIGCGPDEVHQYIHTKSFNHMIQTNKGIMTKLPRAEEEFVTYGAIWTPEAIEYYIGDEKNIVYTFANTKKGWRDWPFDRNFYLILNVAVGGWGAICGVDPKIFPARMEVDYVRVYRSTNPDFC